ncbi:FAD:protein FMN transferase [Pseudooceanicola sp. 200-1SW]|uniref:FAD:protein FMN transferase n=1 Tax=Pseudooceanicola sp. 200-1SW TaxID=3425949 RepID=UPI003D7F7DF2
MQSDFSKRPTRRALLGAATATLALPGLLRAGPRAVETLTGPAFGTAWQVTLPAGQGIDALRAPILALLADVDAQMSPWRADSDISRFNAAGPGACALPAETLAVTGAALALARQSGGHFDPTVGPQVARWGFGPIAGAGAPDWQGLTLDEGAVIKARAGLTLDLCGIAKGHALDRMGALLRAAGHRDFLIDLGGELLARGQHPEGRAWQVAVEDPRPEAAGLAGVLALTGAVATSGLKAQSYTLGGARYGHIIDPATGAPVATGLLSVSVLGASAMQADGWATALFAAAAEGPALARCAGLDALFLSAGAGGLHRQTTGAFAQHLKGV